MSGVCSRCSDIGQCCRYVELPLARALTLDEEHWVSLHPGLSVKNRGRTVRFEVACSALGPDGLCTLYGTDQRPQMCADWPETGIEGEMPPGCAYIEKLALVG